MKRTCIFALLLLGCSSPLPDGYDSIHFGMDKYAALHKLGMPDAEVINGYVMKEIEHEDYDKLVALFLKGDLGSLVFYAKPELCKKELYDEKIVELNKKLGCEGENVQWEDHWTVDWAICLMFKDMPNGLGTVEMGYYPSKDGSPCILTVEFGAASWAKKK